MFMTTGLVTGVATCPIAAYIFSPLGEREEN
jgi:hypothetical protein